MKSQFGNLARARSRFRKNEAGVLGLGPGRRVPVGEKIMTHTKDVFDVAIIGFGPSGATLAHLLGYCGLNVLVLERDGAAYQFPRAVHFDDEVMRVFQTIGLADAIAADTRVNPGMRFVDPQGKLLLDWARAQQVGRHGWHASYRFHQPDLERVLNDEIVRYTNVQVRRQCEAFFLEARGDHVVIRYETCRRARSSKLARRKWSAAMAPDPWCVVSSERKWRTKASMNDGWS